MLNRILLLIVMFISGCLVTLACVSQYVPEQAVIEDKQSASPATCIIANPFNGIPAEQVSPFDRVSENQIHVYDDKVIIDLQDPEWAAFTDTNSMDPFIDSGSNAIEVKPQSESDVHVGDVVSYKSKYADGIIIHRVIEIGNDGEWYCRVKGDNNPAADPGKIRYDQVERVLVAVIY